MVQTKSGKFQIFFGNPSLLSVLGFSKGKTQTQSDKYHFFFLLDPSLNYFAFKLFFCNRSDEEKCSLIVLPNYGYSTHKPPNKRIQNDLNVSFPKLDLAINVTIVKVKCYNQGVFFRRRDSNESD